MPQKGFEQKMLKGENTARWYRVQKKEKKKKKEDAYSQMLLTRSRNGSGASFYSAPFRLDAIWRKASTNKRAPDQKECT